MATYNLKFNKDDSVIGHVVVGLLADLNSKLSFWRQISNDERVVVDVPFFYAVSGDENFLKDAFLFSNVNGPGCDPDGQYADGNYDKVPRGIVNLTSFAVDPAKLVNKRNMGQYSMMNESGLMEGFVAEFEMIPCVIGVDVEILVSSQLDLFKVTEAIVKRMYKANFYNVDAGQLEEGTYRISSEYMMPDDYTQEKPVEYSFDDKANHKIMSDRIVAGTFVIAAVMLNKKFKVKEVEPQNLKALISSLKEMGANIKVEKNIILCCCYYWCFTFWLNNILRIEKK